MNHNMKRAEEGSLIDLTLLSLLAGLVGLVGTVGDGLQRAPVSSRILPF